MLKSVRHPNVLELYEIFYTPTQVILVTDLATGGELYDKILELRVCAIILLCWTLLVTVGSGGTRPRSHTAASTTDASEHYVLAVRATTTGRLYGGARVQHLGPSRGRAGVSALARHRAPRH